MRNYLITGSDGFIGRNLKRSLESSGNSVFSFEEEDALSNDWQDRLRKVFENNKIHGVFHVGACSDTLNQDVNYMMFLNYEFSKYLGNLCMEHRVKMVYSSSAACYGTDGEKPANLYAWSKYAAEGFLHGMGIAVCLRYFNVFGPGEQNKGRMSSVAYQAYYKYYVEKSMKVMELFPKKPQRDFIHVDDVVSANLIAMDKVKAGTTWDIGTGTPCYFEDFMTTFNIPFTYTGPEMIPEGYQFLTCADVNKRLPGWEPKKGIKNRIKDYKESLDLEFKNKK